MTKEEIFEGDKEIREELIQATKEIGRVELKQRLSKLDSTVSRKGYLPVLLILAVLLAVFVTAYLLLRSPTTDVIYAEVYTKFPNKVVAITRGESKEKDLKMAMLAYENGNYQGLLQEFEALEPVHPEVSIYKGIILMEELEYEKAIEELKEVYENDDASFREDASWYLALAYLKIQNKEEARRMLGQLSKNSGKYQDRSAALLKKL
jgi:tetratricopeptide (TPR) repeat protein